MPHSVLRTLARLTLAAAMSILAGLPVATAGANTAADDEAVSEVIVKLRQPADLPAIAGQFGLDPTPVDQLASASLYRLRVTASRSAADISTALELDPRVAYAEPNALVEAPEAREFTPWASGDQTAYTAQWAPQLLHLERAQSVSRGTGVVVAVLDTGVDGSHPALAGAVLPGYDFVDHDADASEVATPESAGTYGHGTHIAGLVALVAPDAKILPVRVLDQHGEGSVWRLAEGLVYAREQGVGVINLSLSTLGRTRLVNDLAAEEGQAVVVAAAGNGANDVPQYPAAESNKVLSVAASTSGDTLASFSTFGSWVRVAAPGDHVTSTMAGGGYATWSGSSMSAALVSGEAVLLKAAYPRLRARDIIDRIVATAAPLNGSVIRRVDPGQALSAAIQPAPSGKSGASGKSGKERPR